MTLNIMLVSPTAVYLSGDFRLTYRTHFGAKIVDDFNVQKLIPVFRLRWSALISFNGVARTPQGLDVGEWIAETASNIDKRASFNELPTALLLANKWLTKLGRLSPLTISLVGFVERRPIQVIISNCVDNLGARVEPYLPNLQVYTSKPKASNVIVLGDNESVTSIMKKKLRQLINGRISPQEVQAGIAEINAEAAIISRENAISPECVTGYLLASGSAAVTPHGTEKLDGYMPSFVTRDLVNLGIIGFRHKFDETGKVLPPHWKGLTAKVQGGPRGDAATGVLHVIKNVGEPVGQPKTNPQVFWKIASDNEPDHYTFRYNKKTKSL